MVPTVADGDVHSAIASSLVLEDGVRALVRVHMSLDCKVNAVLVDEILHVRTLLGAVGRAGFLVLHGVMEARSVERYMPRHHDPRSARAVHGFEVPLQPDVLGGALSGVAV